MRAPTPRPSPRQSRLVELARRAWGGRSVEVVAPEERPSHLTIWDERGRTLLHVEHPNAEAVLALLAEGAPSSAAASTVRPQSLIPMSPSDCMTVLKFKAGKP